MTDSPTDTGKKGNFISSLPVSRREFIKRAIKAGISVAAAGSLAYLLYDEKGPSGETGSGGLVSFKDHSLHDAGAAMAVVRGRDRRETVRAAFERLGGAARFIRKGDVVMLKPNAAFATPANLSATTHPDLISEVISICRQAGAAEVRVTDNPINNPASCFTLTGIADAVQAAGGKLISPHETYFRPTTLKGGTLIVNWPVLFEPFAGVTKLIGITPVKDHHRSGASMTMKNWYGLLGGRRNIFHQDINTIIRELAMMVRPTLMILDGTTTMVTNGPTGGALSDLKQTDTMIVSTDQVAADSYGCSLLGRTVQELPFISMAEVSGAGTSDYRKLNPIIV
jgi:uncharacterized protein (DUF362 family)